MKYFALLGVLLVAVACGSKSDPKFIDPNAGGGETSTAGRVGHGGGAGGGASATGGTGGGVSALAPSVEITTPVAATDPNVGPVLIEDQVTVLCTVTASTAAGAKPVDASTVKIEMFDADRKSLKSSAGTLTKNDNEYAATFVVAPLPNGAVSFTCTASDKATPPNSRSTTVDTLVDRGPAITIGVPADASAHNLLGAMDVQFSTGPVLVTPGDKQASVSKVSLSVGGSTIPTVAKANGVYQATVDFTDKAVFGAPPSGKIPVIITATNSRKSPGAATSVLSYNIVVDGVGPVITVLNPAIGAVVGPASVLTFTVTDSGSGVAPESVSVKLNDTTYAYSATDGRWLVDMLGQYVFKFGAVLAKRLDTQVTVNVLAKDKANNASDPSNTSRLYNLDNQPPTVDLDPALVFETRPGAAQSSLQCSDYFDPVGASPNDLSLITNFGRFRTLVWDETNTKPGQTDYFYATINPGSVQLFVQYDTTSPLLADDDGDGNCDEIWTGTVPHQHKPTDKPLPRLALKPLQSTSYGTVTWGGPNTPPLQGCSAGGTSTAGKLCGNPGVSDMSTVIHHGVGVTEPVIYAIEPVEVQSDILCTGKQWDVATAISMSTDDGKPRLGWVCLAARAVDRVGNPGISPPLRICLDDGTNPDRCKNVAPPTCTDSCKPPPHFVTRPVRHD